ncbi:MAG: hypothetical protein DRJ59_04710 [Thermoprotei archaeon]|nr:MAG: hypothetical protein DRJ59_04710 [Thermoprotei archaeon]
MEERVCGNCRHYDREHYKCPFKPPEWVIIGPYSDHAKECKHFEPKESEEKVDEIKSQNPPVEKTGAEEKKALRPSPPEPRSAQPVEVEENKTTDATPSDSHALKPLLPVEEVEVARDLSLEELEEPAVRVECDAGTVLLELAKEKGFRKPILKITLFDSASQLLDFAQVPYDRIDRLMQPRLSVFRQQLKRILGKQKIAEFLGEVKSRYLPSLMQTLEKQLRARKLLAEKKRRELFEKYKPQLEEVAQDPVKAILEVVDFYHVGDDSAKRQMIPVIASRFLPSAYRLSAILAGPQSLGKNNLVKAFQKVTPRKWWLVATRFTPTALDYLFPEGAKIDRLYLYFMEYEGLRAAKYSVRITISEGELTIFYTARNEKTGELETRVRRLKGTPCIITTTTAPELDPDIESRILYIEPDPSPQQTRQIMELYERLETSLELKEKEAEIKEKAKYVRLYFMLLKPYDVIIPPELFRKLVEDIPMVVRARRDVKKLIAAVKAMAVLRQFNRQRVKDSRGREYLVAEKEDVDYVLTWLKEALKRQMLELREQHVKVLETVPQTGTITAREVAEKLGIPYRTAKAYLDALVEKGLLCCDTKSRPYKYFVKSSSDLENYTER